MMTVRAMAFWIVCGASSALTLLSTIIVMTAEKVAPFSKTMVHFAPRQASFSAGGAPLQVRVSVTVLKSGTHAFPAFGPLSQTWGRLGSRAVQSTAARATAGAVASRTRARRRLIDLMHFLRFEICVSLPR